MEFKVKELQQEWMDNFYSENEFGSNLRRVISEGLVKINKNGEVRNYLSIINAVEDNNTNLFENKSFTTNYNAFFRIRRGTGWQRYYFEYFEKNRANSSLAFEDIFDYMYEKTGRREASFSSKMLACLNHDKPIWDSLAFEALQPIPEDINTIEQIYERYNGLCEWYKRNLQTDIAKKYCSDFDKIFESELTGVKISDTKKIDFLLWGYVKAKKDEERKAKKTKK
jgi:hypothetical protein